MTTPVLLLPGWQNSGPLHWQSLWEKAHGYLRVEQHEWWRPLRGDWIARLEEVLLSVASRAKPAVLVAHSLGCITVAAWAAHSRNRHLVKGALLAAPADVERADVREQLPNWGPIPVQSLPFAGIVFHSSSDPFCAQERSLAIAQAWGARSVDCGACGHINSESGLGDWPAGHAALLELIAGPVLHR